MVGKGYKARMIKYRELSGTNRAKTGTKKIEEPRFYAVYRRQDLLERELGF